MNIVRLSNAQSKIYFGKEDWDIGLARKVMDYMKEHKCGKFWSGAKEKVWFVDNAHIMHIKGIEREMLDRLTADDQEGLFAEEEFMRQFDD